MSQTLLLIDFENVRDVELGALPTDYHVYIFVGRSQNSIPFDLTRQAQQLGQRLEWIKIEGDGRNNLDFHLTFYLGHFSAKHPAAKFLVLSKDKGFDSVLHHAKDRGLDCERIESLSPKATTKSPEGDPHFEKAYERLAGIEIKNRPRRRKTLASKIASDFQKKESAAEIERILGVFFAKGLVSEANNALTYTF